MVHEIKGFPLLKGFRGKAGCDIEAISDVILKVSHLLHSNSTIKELDINPLIAHKKRVTAVDALIVLE